MLDIPNNCSAWCHNSFLHFDVSKGCVELIEEKADDAKVSNVHCLTKARAPYASDFKASGVQCRLDINLQWLGREAIAIQRGALEVSKLRKLVWPFVPSTQVGLGNGTQDNLHWTNTEKKKSFHPNNSTSILYNLNKYTFIHKNRTQERVIFRAHKTIYIRIILKSFYRN